MAVSIKALSSGFSRERVLRFGSVQVFALAKNAPPNVRLLAGLDGGPVGDGSRIYLRTG